jgi:hypothetical protein
MPQFPGDSQYPAFPVGSDPQATRVTAQDYLIAANYSLVVSIDYEIGAGRTTEIGALGVLDIV